MYSKKDDFTNTIQFIIGVRQESLESKSYQTINDLAEIIQHRNDEQKWKPLHFLNTYYLIKNKVEDLISSPIKSSSNLNEILSKSQRFELMSYLKENNIKPTELTRPKTINQIVFMLPPALIMGALLISTYLITAKDFTGWIYLSGLVAIVISVGLMMLTTKLKTKFIEDNLVEYAKLTYTTRHKSLVDIKNTKAQLIQFLTDEVENEFGKKLSPTDIIPES